MQHEKFAKQAAEHLEVKADRLEEKSQWMKLDVTAARANELRVAAQMVRDMAKAVRRAENGPSFEDEPVMVAKNPPLEAQA